MHRFFAIAERSAKDDEAVVDEGVHEHSVFVPRGLDRGIQRASSQLARCTIRTAKVAIEVKLTSANKRCFGMRLLIYR